MPHLQKVWRTIETRRKDEVCSGTPPPPYRCSEHPPTDRYGVVRGLHSLVSLGERERAFHQRRCIHDSSYRQFQYRQSFHLSLRRSLSTLLRVVQSHHTPSRLFHTTLQQLFADSQASLGKEV